MSCVKTQVQYIPHRKSADSLSEFEKFVDQMIGQVEVETFDDQQFDLKAKKLLLSGESLKLINSSIPSQKLSVDPSYGKIKVINRREPAIPLGLPPEDYLDIIDKIYK